MAVETDTIYQGLLRPSKLLGLPLMATAIWVISGATVFMWTERFDTLSLMVVSYVLLLGLTKWDPKFFDVIGVVTKQFGVARNTSIWGGYSYEP